MKEAIINIINRIRPNILLLGLMLTGVIIWDMTNGGDPQIGMIAVGSLAALGGQILDKD